MIMSSRMVRLRLPAAALLVTGLFGCATVDFDQSIDRTNREAAEFTGGKLTLARTNAQRESSAMAVADLLKQPLGQAEAIHLALANSPAVQASLAENWASAASAAQSGRIANPLFALSRVRLGAELDIERTLSFGLLDLLTLPQRYGIAQRRIEEARLRLTADVIEEVTKVRQAWVKAVAAQQSRVYSRQVFESAEASAELARRMQAAGNFSKLARARQHAFYADAATQWAGAQHTATAMREELVRLLGLTDAQATQLKLPDRLPDLPKEPLDPGAVSTAANAERLDVRIAQSVLETTARSQGLNLLTTYTDIELGIRRDTRFDNDSGTKSSGRGYEVSVRLPIFDWGGMQRSALDAQTLAAANRLEATIRAAGSNLREGYMAYRTAYDIARHYRDEVVPLRKTIADENVLRYSGMIIGIFELLADSRDQVSSVIAAIAAEEQFWLADAVLKASIMGKPMMNSGGFMKADTRRAGNAAH